MLTFRNIPWACEPRRWQYDAIEAVKAHFQSGFMSDPEPPLIRAIMGAGKAIAISHLAAAVELKNSEISIVSAPSEYLVRQLYADVKEHCEKAGRTVGLWYGKAKRLGQVVIVCNDSLPSIADKLSKEGVKVKYLLADEAHRTETEDYLEAFARIAPAYVTGFSATPFRSDLKETLSLFKKQIVNYDAFQALKDGVVVPYRVVPWSGDESELDRACVELIQSAKGPGLCNSVSISDAETFAQKCGGVAIHSRLKDAAIRSAIESIRNGSFKCATHVNMLAEGANFPWLHWLGLRRECGSRVRFIQEIGRALRSYPGKEEAVFYDFNDQFGTFPLTIAEALGEPPPRERAEEVSEREPREIAAAITNEREAVSLRISEITIRRLIVACDACGMLGDNRIIMSKTERQDDSNPLQAAAIRSRYEKVSQYVPDLWKPLMRELTRSAERLRKGFSTDFLLALIAIEKSKRFPPLDSEGRISAGIESEVA